MSRAAHTSAHGKLKTIERKNHKKVSINIVHVATQRPMYVHTATHTQNDVKGDANRTHANSEKNREHNMRPKNDKHTPRNRLRLRSKLKAIATREFKRTANRPKKTNLFFYGNHFPFFFSFCFFVRRGKVNVVIT